MLKGLGIGPKATFSYDELDVWDAKDIHDDPCMLDVQSEKQKRCNQAAYMECLGQTVMHQAPYSLVRSGMSSWRVRIDMRLVGQWGGAKAGARVSHGFQFQLSTHPPSLGFSRLQGCFRLRFADYCSS